MLPLYVIRTILNFHPLCDHLSLLPTATRLCILPSTATSRLVVTRKPYRGWDSTGVAVPDVVVDATPRSRFFPTSTKVHFGGKVGQRVKTTDICAIADNPAQGGLLAASFGHDYVRLVNSYWPIIIVLDA